MRRGSLDQLSSSPLTWSASSCWSSGLGHHRCRQESNHFRVGWRPFGCETQRLAASGEGDNVRVLNLRSSLLVQIEMVKKRLPVRSSLHNQ
jgi:hypothetical protein